MKYYAIRYIFFLVLSYSSFLHALVPVEGLLLGRVDDITQVDPFSKMLTYEYPVEDVSKENSRQIENYIGLYRQGIELKNQCDKSQRVRYSNTWKRSSAKRSVIATLQYIGIDNSLKAIVEYAKQFEFSDDKFQLLADNLVSNYCNPNISVYSKKLIRKNFDYFWKNNSKFVLPRIDKSPFYSLGIKAIAKDVRAMNNGFNYTLKNFRAFCSWNGDAENYFLLVPYLSNPFIMSYISNNLQAKKISIDDKTNKLFLESDPHSIRVACENMICRNRSDAEFNRLFPRMIGSTQLGEDIKFLYCEDFHHASNKYSQLESDQKKWINKQTFEEPTLEANNFFSLLTKFPDLLIMSDKFSDVRLGLKTNIKNRWDRWAQTKVSKFDSDLHYEEPLEIKLISQSRSSAAETGRFNILFNVTLGEIDKMVTDHDKIDLNFNLKFSNKYLNNVRKKLITLHNLERSEAVLFEISKVEKHIQHQVKKFAHRVSLPIDSEKMAKILAKEVVDQVNFYNGNKLSKLNYNMINIPVKFNFGIFALRYLREKQKGESFQRTQASI